MIKFVKGGVETDAWANRIMTFLFAEDEAFAALRQTPGKDAFHMACGNQLCVNIRHLARPPAAK